MLDILTVEAVIGVELVEDIETVSPAFESAGVGSECRADLRLGGMMSGREGV